MKFKRKYKGFIEIPGSMIVLIVFVVTCTIILRMMIPVDQRTEAGNIVRKYMFKAEQEGYLSDSNKNKLIEKLVDIGCTNINVTGTFTKVKYGEDVELNVEYDVKVKKVKDTKTDSLIPEQEEVIERVEISKSTVSTTP